MDYNNDFLIFLNTVIMLYVIMHMLVLKIKIALWAVQIDDTLDTLKNAISK